MELRISVCYMVRYRAHGFTQYAPKLDHEPPRSMIRSVGVLAFNRRCAPHADKVGVIAAIHALPLPVLIERLVPHIQKSKTVLVRVIEPLTMGTQARTKGSRTFFSYETL